LRELPAATGAYRRVCLTRHPQANFRPSGTHAQILPLFNGASLIKRGI
jgi:hypothetical protein